MSFAGDSFLGPGVIVRPLTAAIPGTDFAPPTAGIFNNFLRLTVDGAAHRGDSVGSLYFGRAARAWANAWAEVVVLLIRQSVSLSKWNQTTAVTSACADR